LNFHFIFYAYWRLLLFLSKIRLIIAKNRSELLVLFLSVWPRVLLKRPFAEAAMCEAALY
jgi:hypothetical protein